MRQEKTGTLRGTLYIVCVISLFTLPTKAIAGSGTVRATSTMDCDRNCQLMRRRQIQQGNMCADETYNLLHLEECLNKTLRKMMDGLIQLKKLEDKQQPKKIAPNTKTQNQPAIGTYQQKITTQSSPKVETPWILDTLASPISPYWRPVSCHDAICTYEIKYGAENEPHMASINCANWTNSFNNSDYTKIIEGKTGERIAKSICSGR